jgi:hypothetical protein
MDQTSPEMQAKAMHAFMLMVPIMLIGWAVVMAIIIIPLWQICKKAGLSGPLALLSIIPFGILVVLYVVAFSQWRVVPIANTIAYPPSYPPPPAYPPPS